MIEAYKRMFDYRGRSGRKELWIFHLGVVAAGAVLAIVEHLLIKQFGVSPLQRAPWAVWLILLVWQPPMLALFVRRLHDIGWSAKLLLILPLGPLLTVPVFLVRGQAEENKYGPPPGTAPADGTRSATVAMS